MRSYILRAATSKSYVRLSPTRSPYRKWCKERGVKPENPSGALSLRITPQLHRRVAQKAARVGESINQFIVGCLEEVA